MNNRGPPNVKVEIQHSTERADQWSLHCDIEAFIEVRCARYDYMISTLQEEALQAQLQADYHEEIAHHHYNKASHCPIMRCFTFGCRLYGWLGHR